MKKGNLLSIFVALETVIERNTTVSSKIVSLADPDERLNLCCLRNPQKNNALLTCLSQMRSLRFR